ncbi:MAG TPA: cellulase family glycosylhydrolase [Chloroflexota bacterium]|nr:cellulase family glycosylhydrolase [Chloroflexota bacterium]
MTNLPWERFLLGVNYWPVRKAMYWWKYFSADEVRQDFELIKQLNLEAVRFSLLWEDFQPERYKIDVRQMNNLERVLEIADDLKLRCVPTLFTGHMSGYNWLPHWALELGGDNQTPFPIVSNEAVVNRQVKSIFSDPAMVEAQELQARTLAEAFAKHPAVLFWDLGNETSNVEVPRDEETAVTWGSRMAEAIKGAAGEALVSCGLHAEDLEKNRHLSPATMAESNDFLCMHGYSVYSSWAKDKLDSDVCPFLNILTESMGGKPVLFEEFGICTAAPGASGYFADLQTRAGVLHQYFASEDEAAGYYEEVLDKLWNAGSLGAFAWSFGDYDSSLFGAPPCNTHLHERSFGLVRADGSLKPMAEVLQRFAAEPKPIRPLAPERLYSGMDDYYRELPHSLTERFQDFGL